MSEVTPENVVEKQLTPEEVAKQEASEKTQREQMEKQQRFFREMKAGGMFLKAIYKDIERQTREEMNRQQRRRLQKEMSKGYFSAELVDIYLGKVDEILRGIDEGLNQKTIYILPDTLKAGEKFSIIDGRIVKVEIVIPEKVVDPTLVDQTKDGSEQTKPII